MCVQSTNILVYVPVHVCLHVPLVPRILHSLKRAMRLPRVHTPAVIVAVAVQKLQVVCLPRIAQT
jgi:hypothetical protein